MPEYVSKPHTGSMEERLFPWSEEYKTYEEKEIRKALRLFSEHTPAVPPKTSEIKAQLRQQKKTA